LTPASVFLNGNTDEETAKLKKISEQALVTTESGKGETRLSGGGIAHA
jgi:hypothetical protein